ncbi:MAG: DUF1844 domain-containing protein [Phycisphaerae bacterium]|nr:DUF1844 domain-containing protein [Phycisphaerae bacterium]
MADESNGNADAPKIIVDDDWKTQAQAEKEKLAEEAKAGKTSEPPAGDAADQDEDGQPREIPPAGFVSLVNTIAMQTMMALGGVEDPETKKRYVDLGVAKYHIDTLAMLQEKTQGNLSDDEARLLDRALYDLRTGFVQIAQHVRQQAGVEQG